MNDHQCQNLLSAARRTKTGFFHLGYLKRAIHHPGRNCLAAMKCTKGRLNFFFPRAVTPQKSIQLLWHFFKEQQQNCGVKISHQKVTGVRSHMEELWNRGCIHIQASLTHRSCVYELELIINGAAHARSPFTHCSPRANQVILERGPGGMGGGL